MTDSSTIQDMLRALGLTVDQEEAERLSASFQAILADLHKLDAFEASLSSPAPQAEQTDD